MLKLDYLTPESALDAAQDAGPSLVGVIGFPDLPGELPESVPRASVPAEDLQAGAGRGICEVWTSREPVVTAVDGGIRLAATGDFLFGVHTVAERGVGIRAAAEQAYREIFATIGRHGAPHVARFWNYFARINDDEAGLERYRQFNLGRAAAFEAAGRVGDVAIPAACALGFTRGEHLTVSFVATRRAGTSLENPRQVNAYRYPSQYGPQSPLFSRAVIQPAAEGHLLLVSGTASIVGHATLHEGDVAAQTRETLANLRAVFGEAERQAGAGAFPMREASYKVYVRHPADASIVRRELRAALGPDIDAHFIRADICRRDLLVEIEAVASSAVPAAGPGLP